VCSDLDVKGHFMIYISYSSYWPKSKAVGNAWKEPTHIHTRFDTRKTKKPVFATAV